MRSAGDRIACTEGASVDRRPDPRPPTPCGRPRSAPAWCGCARPSWATPPPRRTWPRRRCSTAWRLQHRLTDPGGADAWLNAIARNVCRRWLRARGSAPVPTADLGAGEARDLDSVLEREEVVELLDRALGPAAGRDPRRAGRALRRGAQPRGDRRRGSARRPTRCRCGSAGGGRGCATSWRPGSPTTPSPRAGRAATTPAGSHPAALPRLRAQRYRDAPRRDRGCLPVPDVRPRGLVRPAAARRPGVRRARGRRTPSERDPVAPRQRGPTPTGTRRAPRACAATGP